MTTNESKNRFFYQTNRFESIRITNRIESIRIANWNALVSSSSDVQPEVTTLWRYTNVFIIIRLLLARARASDIDR